MAPISLDVDSDTDIIIAEEEDEQPEVQQRYVLFKFCDNSKNIARNLEVL